MSEYQYYEFLAIDRALDERERAELRALSTRARITPASFVNEYEWGDFRGDPVALMERYFDAFLYFANWGTRRLMIRIPAELLDVQVAERYCSAGAASAWATSEHVILMLSSEQENAARDYWEEPEGQLASIAPARAELASGDLRLLYLGWLLAVQAGHIDDAAPEPPVPPNLRNLSAPLKEFAGFLRIDADLLAVAAAASTEAPGEPVPAVALATWIADLSAAEKDALLLQAASGTGPAIRAIFLRDYRAGQTAAAAGDPDPRPRTAGNLLEAAEALRAEQEQRETERRAAEIARKAAAAAAERERMLDFLAQREEESWQQVSGLIATTAPRRYDEAVAILKNLQALGDRAGDGAAFRDRLLQLRQQHLSKPTLIQRLDQAGLRT